MQKSDRFDPPIAVAKAAARGLKLRREYGRGGTTVGVARASTLSNRKQIGLDTAKRMWSYFSRHEVDKKGKNWGNTAAEGGPSAGEVAWYLWGGDVGYEWVSGIRERAIKAGVW